MHTRSNFTGDWSFACSMRNLGRWSRTAVCSSIGMFTSPNEIEPFQSALATPGVLQLALRLEPVVEVQTVAGAAFEVALIRTHPNLFFRRAGLGGRDFVKRVGGGGRRDVGGLRQRVVRRTARPPGARLRGRSSSCHTCHPVLRVTQVQSAETWRDESR